MPFPEPLVSEETAQEKKSSVVVIPKFFADVPTGSAPQLLKPIIRFYYFINTTNLAVFIKTASAWLAQSVERETLSHTFSESD
jgi:hypothetical protein